MSLQLVCSPVLGALDPNAPFNSLRSPPRGAFIDIEFNPEGTVESPMIFPTLELGPGSPLSLLDGLLLSPLSPGSPAPSPLSGTKRKSSECVIGSPPLKRTTANKENPVVIKSDADPMFSEDYGAVEEALALSLCLDGPDELDHEPEEKAVDGDDMNYAELSNAFKYCKKIWGVPPVEDSPYGGVLDYFMKDNFSADLRRGFKSIGYQDGDDVVDKAYIPLCTCLPGMLFNFLCKMNKDSSITTPDLYSKMLPGTYRVKDSPWDVALKEHMNKYKNSNALITDQEKKEKKESADKMIRFCNLKFDPRISDHTAIFGAAILANESIYIPRGDLDIPGHAHKIRTFLAEDTSDRAAGILLGHFSLNTGRGKDGSWTRAAKHNLFLSQEVGYFLSLHRGPHLKLLLKSFHHVTKGERKEGKDGLGLRVDGQTKQVTVTSKRICKTVADIFNKKLAYCPKASTQCPICAHIMQQLHPDWMFLNSTTDVQMSLGS